MNPSPSALAWINTFAAGLPGGWASNNDAAVVSSANALTVANPAAQGAVAKPFVAADLANACSQANRANLGLYLVGASGLIIGQDASYLSAGLDALAVLGEISTADATAMKAILTATEPDPSYQPHIGPAQSNVGRPIDAADVSAARAQYAPGTTD